MSHEEWSDRVRDRLGEALRSSGMSQRALAKALGVSESAVSQWMNRQSETDWWTLKGLAEALGTSLDYVLGISDSLSAEAPVIAMDGDEYASLPIRVEAGAGRATFVRDDDDARRLAFRRDWLRQVCGTDQITDDVAFLVRVKGESMEPTLRNGAVVLARHWYPPPLDDRDGPWIEDGAIYVIRDEDGGLQVKRLTIDSNAQALVVSSDNPAWRPRVVALEGQDLAGIIIGKVVWVSDRLER